MTPSISLYNIEDALLQLAELRDQAEAEGDTEALKAIDGELAHYDLRKAQKIDSYVGLIQQREDIEEACKKRAQQFLDAAAAARRDIDRLKANAKGVMEAFGVTKLKTETHQLRIQNNGGVEPLEIPDPGAVQVKYLLMRLTLTGPMQAILLWMLENCVGEIDDPEARQAAGDLAGEMMRAGHEPDNEAIRAALKQPCPKCDGSGVFQRRVADAEVVDEPCVVCGGDGKNRVPGARLLERGTHLRVS